MADGIQKGIIGILALLFGFGGTMLLTQDQIDNAYICTANEKIGFFDSFSSTMKTGYWSEDGQDFSSVCRGGEWVKFTEYARAKGVDPETFLYKTNPAESEKTPGSRKAEYICTYGSCMPKN
jgi:hypothetical protein